MRLRPGKPRYRPIDLTWFEIMYTNKETIQSVESLIIRFRLLMGSCKQSSTIEVQQ